MQHFHTENILTHLKARLALFSANVVAWLLSFLSSAEAAEDSRQRATMLIIHILSGSKHSCSSLQGENNNKTGSVEKTETNLGCRGVLIYSNYFS